MPTRVDAEVIELRKAESEVTPRPPRNSYPFHRMDVGDYFDVGLRKANSAHAAACQYGKRHGQSFATRRMGRFLRVWRLS